VRIRRDRREDLLRARAANNAMGRISIRSARPPSTIAACGAPGSRGNGWGQFFSVIGSGGCPWGTPTPWPKGLPEQKERKLREGRNSHRACALAYENGCPQ
jgi:hypothetical protein